jgi:hypothetical protein
MGQQRTQYALAKKVELLDQRASGESIAKIAEKAGIPAATVFNWSANEKAIRAAYAKELKQEAKANGASNNGANGHAKAAVKPAAEKETTTKLQIIGLTPLIKELVQAELRGQLPALVKEAINEAFAGKRAN